MYATLDDVKAKNRAIDHHWLDADTIRFFKTRFPTIPTATGGLVAGRFFVTSELPPHDGRRSSIRCALDGGTVETVGEFCEYPNPRAAVRALYAALDGGVEVRNDPYDDAREPENPEQFHWRAFIGELPIGVRTDRATAEEIAAEVEQGL